MQTQRWSKTQIREFFDLPFIELMNRASSVHLQHHKSDEIEFCSLLSIKTGACPEDCAYCPQSGHYKTGLQKEKLLPLAEVLTRAQEAKTSGAKRFCMGAAWRNPSEKDFPVVLEMIKAVKELGLETCVTLGKLTQQQANALHEAGLDYYNHNLDTSPEYYSNIISTHTYEDRLETLNHIQNSGVNVCCGGILGMGETREDRIGLLAGIANLPQPPKSVPINNLIAVPGTPLANSKPLDNLEFVRTIAVARILLPEAMIRLSAGRKNMSAEMQALCFTAGANSIWLGEKLLTTQNTDHEQDLQLLKNLGFQQPVHA